MGTERRFAERVFTRMRLLYGLEVPEAQGCALNLSAGGVFIASARPHLPGTSLRIRLLPAGAEAVDLRGTVCWGQRIPPRLAPVVQPGMGVCLSAPPDAYFDLLASLRGPAVRRAYPRLAARLEVRYRHRELVLKEYTENISQGGLFIATREPFERGAPVQVELVIGELPTALPLEGRVAYRLDQQEASALGTTPGIGVQITAIDPRTKDALRSYVQRITRLYE